MTFGFEIINDNGVATIDSENSQFTIDSLEFYADGTSLAAIGDRPLWRPDAGTGEIWLDVNPSITFVKCVGGIRAARAVPAGDAISVTGDWGVQVFDGSATKVFDSRKKIATPISTTSILISSIPAYPSFHNIALPAPKHGKKRYVTSNLFGMVAIESVAVNTSVFISCGIEFFANGDVGIFTKEVGSAPPIEVFPPNDARVYIAILDA